MKGYPSLPKAPGLKPHHRIFSVISNDGVGVFYRPYWMGWNVLNKMVKYEKTIVIVEVNLVALNNVTIYWLYEVWVGLSIQKKPSFPLYFSICSLIKHFTVISLRIIGKSINSKPISSLHFLCLYHSISLLPLSLYSTSSLSLSFSLRLPFFLTFSLFLPLCFCFCLYFFAFVIYSLSFILCLFFSIQLRN